MRRFGSRNATEGVPYLDMKIKMERCCHFKIYHYPDNMDLVLQPGIHNGLCCFRT